MTQIKECVTCMEPTDSFYPRSKECKRCHKIRSRINNRARWERMRESRGEEKEWKPCYACKRMLRASLDNFDRGTGKYGLRGECVGCRRARQRVNYVPAEARKQARIERLAEKIKQMGVGA